MRTFILDTEGDNLFPAITKFWCVVLKEYKTDNLHLFSDAVSEYMDIPVRPLKEVRPFIQNNVDRLVAHNLLGFDLMAMKKLLGLTYTVLPDTIDGKTKRIVDTLALSRYLYPDRKLPRGCPTHQEVAGQNKLSPVGAHSLYAWGYRVGVGKPEVLDWQTQPIGVYLNRCIEDTKINDLVYTELLKEMKQ